MSSNDMIDQGEFYTEYHGHLVKHLEVVHKHLRNSTGSDGIIWLAGDSSLDNKHWFGDSAPAVHGYEKFLKPPRSKKDIAYWMNYHLMKKMMNVAVINTAVEESCVGDRSRCRLMEQDLFIRDNILPNDALVISLGGNDIALKPSPCTALNLLALVNCTPVACVRDCSCGTSIPLDDPCCGCACGCLSNLLAWPLGLGYFVHLFRSRVASIIDRITAKIRPKTIFVCMIYFLDEKPTKGWAETALNAMQYNTNPAKLQLIIRKLFELATSSINIPGSKVVGIPLFVPLDGKTTAHYSQRVEPSAEGGDKMGKYIIDEFVCKYYQSSTVKEEEGGTTEDAAVAVAMSR